LRPYQKFLQAFVMYLKEICVPFYVTVTILDVIHHPVFLFKTRSSDTRFCLCLHVEPTQLGQIIELVCPSTKFYVHMFV
jgi:hypothetical protein